MSEYKVDKNHGLTIEILNKQSGAGSSGRNSHNKPTGIIPVKKEDVVLKRRSQSSLINFWDLGIYKNESDDWVEIDSVLKPGYDDSSGIIAGNLPMTLTQYQILMDKIFEIDINDWKTRYHKIEYEEAERYGFDLEIDDREFPVGRDGSRNIVFSADPITQGKWTDKGLKYQSIGTGLVLKGYLGFNYFDTSNTTRYKITETYDFAADEVEFNPKGPIDFYLVPRIVSGNGSTIINIGGTPALLKFQTVVLNYFMMRRAYYLDMAFGDIMPLAGYRLFDLSSSNKLSIKNEAVDEPRNTEGIVQNAYGYDVTPHPTPPDPDTESPATFASGATFFNLAQTRANYAAGFLLAVAKNGSKNYFIWSKDGNQSFSPTLGFTWS
jgi:hypothetical protein